MKQKIKILIMLIFLIIMPNKVNAATCNEKANNELIKNIQITYRHLTKEEAIEKFNIHSSNIYTFNISNVPKDMIIEINSTEKTISNETTNELINIENFSWGTGGNTISFSVYNKEYNPCFFYELKEIKLPWYNSYSETDFCKDNKDFKYCKKYLKVRITETNFNKEKERYENNKEKELSEKKEEDKNTNLLTFISDNYMSIICITFLLIIVISTIIKIRKRKRRKI